MFHYKRNNYLSNSVKIFCLWWSTYKVIILGHSLKNMELFYHPIFSLNLIYKLIFLFLIRPALHKCWKTRISLKSSCFPLFFSWYSNVSPFSWNDYWLRIFLTTPHKKFIINKQFYRDVLYMPHCGFLQHFSSRNSRIYITNFWRWITVDLLIKRLFKIYVNILLLYRA